MNDKILHIVHTIDTEGPLDEDLTATFERIRDLFGIDLPPSRSTLADLQQGRLALGGLEDKVAKVIAPELLAYNRNWQSIQTMLDEALSPEFRRQVLDDFDGGWAYSWHCVDHLGFRDNPRHKDKGYGNVFRFYRNALRESGSTRDELNWHFHPLSITREPLAAATSFINSLDVLLDVWCRRLIEDDWFPTTNRPGFHSERSDANLFLEQWLPFDYANQFVSEADTGQRDASMGRFGDWRRASPSWRGYHPDHDDYQVSGHCRRWIFRCLNIGTRFRLMQREHLVEAFEDARLHGSAIIAFADHDYRDLRPDVRQFRDLLAAVRPLYGDVKIKFSGAHEAARAHAMVSEPALEATAPKLDVRLEDGRLQVRLLEGQVFGPQPFLALRDKAGRYFHDNFDMIEPGRAWTYVLDAQTLPVERLDAIGVGCAGRVGGSFTQTLRL